MSYPDRLQNAITRCAMRAAYKCGIGGPGLSDSLTTGDLPMHDGRSNDTAGDGCVDWQPPATTVCHEASLSDSPRLPIEKAVAESLELGREEVAGSPAPLVYHI